MKVVRHNNKFVQKKNLLVAIMKKSFQEKLGHECAPKKRLSLVSD